MPIPFLAQLALGVGLQVLGYLLMPKPKPPKPPATEDVEDPTAETGRPIPVMFGSITLQGPNNMGFWDKEIQTRKANTGGKK